MTEHGTPEWWGSARLADIAEVRLGRQRSPARAQGDHMRPYMRAANVTWGGISTADVKEMDFTPQEQKIYELKSGDILLSEASGSPEEVGKPAIWRNDLPGSCFQNTLIRVRIGEPGLVKFLYLHFLKDALTGRFASASRGVGIHHLGAEALSDWQVTVPPLPEQHRIVEAIESYFSRLDEAVALLERVKRNLKRYRASVLQAAVTGKLVPTEAELARRQKVEAASRRFVFQTEPTRQDGASTDDDGMSVVEAASRRFVLRSALTRQDAASTNAPTECLAVPNADDFGPCFFDPGEPIGHRTGNLPHWHQDARTYFVTFRLADSLPSDVVQQILAEHVAWLQAHPLPHTPVQDREYRRFTAIFDRIMDQGVGTCVLQQAPVRQVVRDALFFFDGERYFLHDWVIMPNHVHILLTLRPDQVLSAILHSIKSFSAKEINKLLGRIGPLWQKESFDHIVRNVESFERIRQYIHNNPAGLPLGSFSLGIERERWSEERLTRRDAASTYEPASVLLQRILAERRRRWAESGRRGKYLEPVAPDTSGLPELPEGWCWATVDMVAEVGTGATPKRGDDRYWNGGCVPWVTSALAGLGLVTDPSDYVTETALRETNLMLYPPGTLVVAMYGEGKTRGRCAELGIKATTNQALAALVTTGTAESLRPWLKLFMAFNYDNIRRHASGGVQPNLNLSIVRSIVLPLPPAAEQARITAEVDAGLSVTQSVKEEFERQLVKTNRLRQSILKWAFEGKLADQDPNDEPAAELLKRIRAERAASAKTKSTGRGRRARLECEST